MYFILISEIQLLCLPIEKKNNNNPQTIIHAYGEMQKKRRDFL